MNARWLRSMLALGLLFSGVTVYAQVPQQNFRFGVLLGVTSGGDTLASVRFTNGDTEKIKAGGFFHFAGGVVWTPQQIPFGGHLMVGYHVDDVTADNGDLRFSRYPIELMAFYKPVQPLRLGLGARYVSSAKLAVDVPGSNSNVTFKNTVGLVAEIGYHFTPTGWVSLRGTFEDYKVKSINGTAVTATGTSSGNSIGLYVGGAF